MLRTVAEANETPFSDKNVSFIMLMLYMPNDYPYITLIPINIARVTNNESVSMPYHQCKN